MRHIGPAQRQRLRDIRASLTVRITEAKREGRTGEAEGLNDRNAGGTRQRPGGDQTYLLT